MRHPQGKENTRPEPSPRLRQNDLIEAMTTSEQVDNAEFISFVQREIDRLGEGK